MLTDAQLTKLHKLAALIPPPRGGDEWQQLKSQLAIMLRLVRGVHLATPHTHKHDAGSNASHSAVQIIDARPLTRHDPNWNTTLPPTSPTSSPPPTAEIQTTQVLDRHSQLLSKVAPTSKYQAFFLVHRT